MDRAHPTPWKGPLCQSSNTFPLLPPPQAEHSPDLAASRGRELRPQSKLQLPKVPRSQVPGKGRDRGCYGAQMGKGRWGQRAMMERARGRTVLEGERIPRGSAGMCRGRAADGPAQPRVDGTRQLRDLALSSAQLLVPSGCSHSMLVPRSLTPVLSAGASEGSRAQSNSKEQPAQSSPGASFPGEIPNLSEP